MAVDRATRSSWYHLFSRAKLHYKDIGEVHNVLFKVKFAKINLDMCRLVNEAAKDLIAQIHAFSQVIVIMMQVIVINSTFIDCYKKTYTPAQWADLQKK
jgi:hypothetical protein